MAMLPPLRENAPNIYDDQFIQDEVINPYDNLPTDLPVIPQNKRVVNPQATGRTYGRTQDPGNIPEYWAQGFGFNIDANLSAQQQSMMSGSPTVTGPIRTGGGTGGGSEVSTLDPMSANALVAENLNPYLTQNVHSFRGGGRMHDPYKYNNGGGFPQQTMSYTDQANEMIALNQLSGLGQRVMANRGMRIPRYNEGGMTVQEANASGKKYVINQDGSAQILDFQGVGPGREISRVAMDPALLGGGTKTPSASLPWDRQVMSRTSPPKDIYRETGGLEDQYAPLAPVMAKKGMKMRKRYTQGGRF